MKSFVLYLALLSCPSLMCQAPAATVPVAAGAHSNINPPLEDWPRFGIHAEDNKRLAAIPIAKPRVVFLGDSITNHWMDAKYSPLFQQNPNFIDRGVLGNNAAQMLLRYRADVLALQPKVVVLLAGTNDLVAFKLPDTLGFIEQSISSIVELAQLHHERIILCSLLPVSDVIRNQTNVRHPEDILRFNAWLKNYAAEKKLQYVDFYSAVSDGHDRIQTALTIDGLHPNAEGYKKMDPLITRAIHELTHPSGHCTGNRLRKRYSFSRRRPRKFVDSRIGFSMDVQQAAHRP